MPVRIIYNVILVILSLAFSAFVSSWLLRLFLNKEIRLSRAIRVSCVAVALNRLLLTGSGYAAMSYKLKKDNLPFHKTLSSFAALELFTILPWLALGLYFGSKLAVKAPVIFALPLGIFLIFAVLKRHKAAAFLKDAWKHIKEARRNVFLIIPLIIVNLCAGVIYYFFLLRVFGFVFGPLDVLRIATISFTVGYLSPAPAGIGFKESGMVLLLMQKNIPLMSALSIAVTDRILVTAFYLILGFLCAGDLILKETLSALRRK